MFKLYLAIGACLAAAVAANDSVNVPQCPNLASVAFTTAIPSGPPCPATKVDLCYTSTQLHLTFTAYNETNFYYNADHQTNDDIWAYEAMEAFISRGPDDPQTYFEYEVSPNNVAFNAFIFNPSRVRKDGAPMDQAFIGDPLADGFTVNTKTDKEKGLWVTESVVPLALFNGETPKGSVWRMNFFRTVTSPQMFPDQQLCGWRNTGEANFHVTPVFGKINFV
ncbi:hypothetical protein H4S02_001839 [Coemansia sp. RSA 2611]|nr:hypothetical protein IWW54_000841 [Coemansia sp. RSA 2705]KAJ2319895.1 hypothetical protein IWW52_001697 [Coemansia sp. RSA 2704]KAJ2329624.1 hypothetical protein IWW51_000488 [Coemansia sp. RSA 2702]KAJ2390487.1 hypothetical protein H4S02_001839 [Coemansia sp. RSA 2611]KAJ2737832.1 hypothetical protein H4R23_001572 [Coemansia sp. Cherry 401B]